MITYDEIAEFYDYIFYERESIEKTFSKIDSLTLEIEKQLAIMNKINNSNMFIFWLRNCVLKHFDKAQTKVENLIKEKEDLIYSVKTKTDNLLTYINGTKIVLQN